MHVEYTDQVNVGYFHQSAFILFFRQGLTLNLELTHWANKGQSAGLCTPHPTHSLLLSTPSVRATEAQHRIVVGAGDPKSGFSCLHSKYFTESSLQLSLPFKSMQVVQVF